MPSTIVMTGASRGIGRVAAERILRESPDTHLVLVTRGPLAGGIGAGGRPVPYVATASAAAARSR